jgi:hypothetical protein
MGEEPEPRRGGGFGGGTSGFGSTTDGGEGGAAPQTPDAGVATLCEPCDSHEKCGDAFDRCVGLDNRWYCAMACGYDGACPDGYHCRDVIEGPQDSWQCVPERNACGASSTPDEMRAYALQVVNELRNRRNLDPLKMTECLNMIGQDSVVEYEAQRTPFTKFNRECKKLIPNCDCGWQAEHPGVPGINFRTWQEAILEHIEAAAADPESTGANVVSQEWDEIGIGVLLREDNVWLTLEFAP